MTAYQGGKKRIGKKIHQVISLIDKDLNNQEKKNYFEPFIGMGGVMRHFGKENNRKLFACDANKDLILLWKALQKGTWKPPKKCSRKKYEQFKKNKEHSADRAFIGITCSWGCMFFRNYRLHYNKDKDYMAEGYRGLLDIKPDIQNVKFYNACAYNHWDPQDMLIYCDPPYKGNNLGSYFFTQFDSDIFWEEMREWSKNNTVIISESSAPKDFKQIWCVKSLTTNAGKTKRYKDCLYLHSSIYNKLKKNTKQHLRDI